MDLKDRVCIVTGAARGLGKAIAETFSSEGGLVALWDVSEINLSHGYSLDAGRCKSWQVDVTSEDSVRTSVDDVAEAFGGIDVLVTCAGILKHVPIEEKTLESFEAVIKVNLTGTFLCCKYAIPYMKKRGKGKIVNMSSLGGRTGRPGVAVDYAAAKAGVVAMTQVLAKEQGPNGIYANAMAPGPILTELTKQVGPELFAKWNVGRAVNKDGLPEDVAQLALFLASDRSDWITGVTIDINGGIYMR